MIPKWEIRYVVKGHSCYRKKYVLKGQVYNSKIHWLTNSNFYVIIKQLFFGRRSSTLLQKILQHRCFPANFSKFLKTPFLQNTSGWLLLFIRFFKGNRVFWSRCWKNNNYHDEKSKLFYRLCKIVALKELNEGSIINLISYGSDNNNRNASRKILLDSITLILIHWKIWWNIFMTMELGFEFSYIVFIRFFLIF